MSDRENLAALGIATKCPAPVQSPNSRQLMASVVFDFRRIAVELLGSGSHLESHGQALRVAQSQMLVKASERRTIQHVEKETQLSVVLTRAAVLECRGSWLNAIPFDGGKIREEKLSSSHEVKLAGVCERLTLTTFIPQACHRAISHRF